MAKVVGLSRNIKLLWLNYTVELLLDGLSDEEIRDKLNIYLGYEIKSETNLRKSREILFRIWATPNEYSDKLRDKALELVEKYPEYKLAIHWCMLLVAYPIFYTVNWYIGKLFDFKDVVKLSQIREKLYDEWGERTTLYHSLDKLLATLKNFDVLDSKGKGMYSLKIYDIPNKEVVKFMLYTLMLVEGKTYYSCANLSEQPVFYPFKFSIDKADISNDDRFKLTLFNGETNVVLPDT